MSDRQKLKIWRTTTGGYAGYRISLSDVYTHVCKCGNMYFEHASEHHRSACPRCNDLVRRECEIRSKIES